MTTKLLFHFQKQIHNNVKFGNRKKKKAAFDGGFRWSEVRKKKPVAKICQISTIQFVVCCQSHKMINDFVFHTWCLARFG